jgi:hypothetical protein
MLGCNVQSSKSNGFLLLSIVGASVQVLLSYLELLPFTSWKLDCSATATSRLNCGTRPYGSCSDALGLDIGDFVEFILERSQHVPKVLLFQSRVSDSELME